MLTIQQVFNKATKILRTVPHSEIFSKGFCYFMLDPENRPDDQFLPVKLHTVTVNGALFDSGIPRDMDTWHLIVDIETMVSTVPVHSWERWLTIIKEQWGLSEAA